MGKSYNTKPPNIKAQQEYDAVRNKSKFYPRVIERKAYPGDKHPVSKKKIQHILKSIPKEYVYGVTEIELRAREPNRGKPLGYYGTQDQKIVLYSLPEVMQINKRKIRCSRRLKDYYESYEATVEMDEASLYVSWQEIAWKEYWFIKHVVLHELGHHYSEFYKCKRKAPDSRWKQEYLANYYRDKLVRDHWTYFVPFKVYWDIVKSV